MAFSPLISKEAAVIVLDGNGSIECLSGGARDLLGPPLDECRHAIDLLHTYAPQPGGRASAAALWADLAATPPQRSTGPLAGRTVDGAGEIDILLHFLPVDRKVILAVEQSANSREIARSKPGIPISRCEMPYRKLLDSMTDAFVSVSMDGWITGSNKAYQKLTGYTSEELSGLKYFDLTPAKWHEMEAGIVEKQVIPNGHSEVYEKECRRKDGAIIAIELRTFLVRDDEGQPGAMWAIVRDLTVRRKLQQAERGRCDDLEQLVRERTAELEESEVRLRHLSAATSEGIAILDQGVIIDANAQLRAMLRSESSGLIGRHVIDFTDPASKAALRRRLEQEDVGTYQLDVMRADGTTFPGEIRPTIMDIKGRRLRLCALRDLTENRRMQAELELRRRQLEKARHLGTLAELEAGIVHQISQPLTAACNTVSAAIVASGRCRSSSCLIADELVAIEESLGLMRLIVVGLRRYAHSREINREQVSLNQLVTQTIRIIGNFSLSDDIEIVTDLDQDLPLLEGDPMQISQVFTNLLHNAAEAAEHAPEGVQKITVATRTHDPRTVEFTVSDTGPGIDDEILQRIFEPFFTTKKKGTGIGLAFCRRIVSAHGGTIGVSNRRNGPGATFRVTLPVSTPEP